MGRKDQSTSFDYEVTHYSSDPIAQLNHQAYGSHAMVDDQFDHFMNDDQFIGRDGRLVPVWEMSNAS
jgi:hypothetical protein